MLGLEWSSCRSSPNPIIHPALSLSCARGLHPRAPVASWQFAQCAWRSSRTQSGVDYSSNLHFRWVLERSRVLHSLHTAKPSTAARLQCPGSCLLLTHWIGAPVGLQKLRRTFGLYCWRIRNFGGFPKRHELRRPPQDSHPVSRFFLRSLPIQPCWPTKAVLECHMFAVNGQQNTDHVLNLNLFALHGRYRTPIQSPKPTTGKNSAGAFLNQV